MRVDGELLRAQMEQYLGTPEDEIAARIYADVTDPTAILPKFYNGSSWKTLAFTSASAIYSQNSGKAVTVDWSNGSTQVVNLTDNTVISFSNPVEGSEYRLIVRQNSTATLGDGNLYNYTLNSSEIETKGEPLQPSSVIPLGKQRTYKLLYNAGVTPAVSNVPSQTYTILNYTATAHFGSAFSRDGKAWASSRGTTPYVDVALAFNTSPTQQNPLGYINLVTPTAAVGVCTDVVFHPVKNIMVQANQTTPYIQTFFLNTYSPSPAAIANPGTLPTGAANCAFIHPTGNYVGVGHATTPFMSVYPFDGTAYGTKLSNPATLPASLVTAAAFSDQGDYLAVAFNTASPSNNFHVYPFTDAAGTGSFGAAITASLAGFPASVGVGAKGVAWRPQGDYIAVALNASPYLQVLPFNRTTGTLSSSISVSSSGLVAAANSVAWSPCGNYLAVCTNTTGTTLFVYDFSSQTIGAGVTFDGGNASGVNMNCVSICPNGEYMVVAYNASPWSVIYSMPKKIKNYLLLDMQ